MNLKRPRFLNKASSQEKQLQQEQSQFYTTLTQDYAQQFAGQQAILNSLKTAFDPILAGGINQYGFNAQEDTSLRTSSSDAIAQQTANAQTALNENIASRGGGNTFLPSGATAQLEAGLLSSEATQQATTANQITQAGYTQGRSNFLAAASALSGNAALMNPTGYIGGTNQAGSDAFSSANIINQQNTAWQGALGGALGGIAGAAIGGPFGAALGSSIFGGGSGGSTPFNDPNSGPGYA